MSLWTSFKNPFGANRVPILYGLASDGSSTPVPVAVDPATGRVQTTSTVSFTPTSLTTVLSGRASVTTAATRVQLPSNPVASVTIKALVTNTGVIYVGGPGVASGNGFQLAAGDSVSFDISNTNAIYIDSSVNGEGVAWLAVD